MQGGSSPELTVDKIVAMIVESDDWNELLRGVMTELKRAGDLMHAEDDVHKVMKKKKLKRNFLQQTA